MMMNKIPGMIPGLGRGKDYKNGGLLQWMLKRS